MTSILHSRKKNLFTLKRAWHWHRLSCVASNSHDHQLKSHLSCERSFNKTSLSRQQHNEELVRFIILGRRQKENENIIIFVTVNCRSKGLLGISIKAWHWHVWWTVWSWSVFRKYSIEDFFKERRIHVTN